MTGTAERRRPDRIAQFWKLMGGRKGFHGYIAYVTLTIMAFALDATFGEYAIGILAALGITSSAIAYEDRQAASPAPATPPELKP